MTHWHTQHQHDEGFLVYKGKRWMALQPSGSDLAEDTLPPALTGILYCPWCPAKLNEDGTWTYLHQLTDVRNP